MSHHFVSPSCQFLEWFCSGSRAFSRLSCIKEPSSGCLEMFAPITNHPWFSSSAKYLLREDQGYSLYLVACT